MKEKKSVQRNSAIELLRIISMFIIVLHHFFNHGGLTWGPTEIVLPLFWYNLILLVGRVGLNTFVLITGYFLIEKNNTLFDFSRISKFWGQVIFYSVSIFALLFVCGLTKFSFTSLISAILPITFSSWWFATTFFALLLFYPFLNKLLNCLDKKSYQLLLLLGVICWSVFPTFLNHSLEGNYLLWFMALYAIGGYAKKFGFSEKLKAKHYFGLYAIFIVLNYLSSVVLMLLGTKWSFFAKQQTYFFGQEKVLILLASISIFMGFATMKMNYHKWINVVSSATFGVYLIHESKLFRDFLWVDLFKAGQFKNSSWLISYSILAAIVVYAVCTIIDLIRQKVFEKPFMMLVKKIQNNFSKPVKK